MNYTVRVYRHRSRGRTYKWGFEMIGGCLPDKPKPKHWSGRGFASAGDALTAWMLQTMKYVGFDFVVETTDYLADQVMKKLES